MANKVYDKGREGFATAQINWPTDDIRAILINTSLYTVNLATHQFLSDVAVGSRVATTSLASRTATNGVLAAGNATFTAATGAASGALIIYKHTGTDTTARLIIYIDTAGGLPVTPNGGDINVTWDVTNKIAKL